MDARAWRDGIYASTAVQGGICGSARRTNGRRRGYPRVAERRGHRQCVLRRGQLAPPADITDAFSSQGGARTFLITPRNWPAVGGYNISPRWAIRALAGGETRDGSFTGSLHNLVEQEWEPVAPTHKCDCLRLTDLDGRPPPPTADEEPGADCRLLCRRLPTRLAGGRAPGTNHTHPTTV